jgi:dTDP-4-amino-4,6-dideoxygalactose transaminase
MNTVAEFENAIKEFYGAKFAVAVDCCTHAIELCLRLIKPKSVTSPKHTYLSVPMTFNKLAIPFKWIDYKWSDFYFITNTNIIDAAVYWKQGGYIPNTLMCLSFQFKKHLSLSRGGMILLDNEQQYNVLRKMRYDGRTDDLPWAEQQVDTMGYHYYMTPETAKLGLEKLELAKQTEPRKWSYQDYPDISKMPVFEKQHA